MTLIRRPPVTPGATVEIEVPDIPGGVVARTVVTVRDHGDGRLTCCLRGPSEEIEAVTIHPAPDHPGWVCVEPPVNIAAAALLAQRVLRGEVLQGPATTPLRRLAEAVCELTGARPPRAPSSTTRLREVPR